MHGVMQQDSSKATHMIRLSIAACVPQLRQEQPGTPKDNDTCNQRCLAYQHIVLQCAKGLWWLDWLQQSGSWSHTGNNAHGDCHEVQNTSLHYAMSFISTVVWASWHAVVYLTAHHHRPDLCTSLRLVPAAAEAVACCHLQ